MLYAGYLFLVSSVLFLVGIVFVVLEKKSNRRFILSNTRDRLDSGILYIDAVIRAKYALILKRSLKLSWYYSLHTMLKAVMGLLVHSYDRLERVVIKNRARAKKVRAESRVLLQDNHLTEIEKHKQDTALTSKQKKKLRAEKLERD
jgi:hypothetical protein